jgi:flagellar motor switch protein FliM
MAEDMKAENRPSAMRLKAGVMRPPPEVGRLTPGGALRAAVAQAAEEVAALRAVAGAAEESRVTLEPFIAGLPEAALLALVEGPEGRFGLVVLDAQVVGALIEIQTTGRVVPRPAEPRAPTRTDAIMCADFIDRMLELVEARLGEAGLAVAPALAGFRYAMALAEPRTVAMTLEDRPYRLYRLAVDFDGGAKSGAIALLLPQEPAERGARGGPDAAGFAAALERQVLNARAELAATLIRREMRLSEVLALAPGGLIPLPRAALSRVAVEDLAGRVVAHGRLGQLGGNRAVRLVPEPLVDEGEPEGGVVRGAASGAFGADAGTLPPAGPAAGPGDPGDPGGFGGDDPGNLAEPAELAGPDDLAGFGQVVV